MFRLVIMALAGFAAFCLPSSSVPAEEARIPPDIQKVVDKFFEAWGREDLDALMALWSEESADYQKQKKAFSGWFGQYDYTFNKVSMLSDKVEGKGARVRVKLEFQVKFHQRVMSQQSIRTLLFTRQRKAWRVIKYYSEANAVAAALAKAPRKKREAMLAQERELWSSELARALAVQGAQRTLIRAYAEAQSLSELAARVARDVGEKKVLALVLDNIAFVHQRRGDHAQALAVYRRSLKVKEELGDKAGIAYTLNYIGGLHYSRRDYAQALAVYRRSLKLAEDLGDKAGIARTLTNIGVVHYRQGEYAQALQFHRRSLKLAEELGDKARIANTLTNIGDVHFRQGEYAQALAVCGRSLKLKEDLGDKSGIAATLNNIGVVHYRQGDYGQALAVHRRSLKLAEELGDKAGIARLLTIIGDVHYRQGDHAQALAVHRRSLKLAEELGDKSGIALMLTGIGNFHYRQGDYAQALEVHRRSLKLAEELGDKSGIANTLNTIGVVHQSLGDHAQALAVHRRSLKLAEELGDKSGIANTLNNIGNFRYRQGHYAQALAVHRRSLKLAEDLGDKSGIARTLTNIGNVHQGQGNYAQALEWAQRAEMTAEEADNREVLWRARWSRGRTLIKLRRLDEAQKALKASVAVIESLRSDVGGGEKEQQRAFENKVDVYHTLMEVLLAQGKPVVALVAAGNSKARTLLDVLTSGRVDFAGTKTGEEQAQEREHHLHLASLNTKLLRLQQNRRADKQAIAKVKQVLQQARFDYESFQTSLYAAHPELKIQRAELPPFTLARAAELLPDKKTVLLEFVSAKQQTWLFALVRQDKGDSPVRLKVHSIPISRRNLAEKVKQLRQSILNLSPRYGELARQFYTLLLSPAQKDLDGKTRLIISPDGPLWEVPWPALSPAKGRYLVEEAAVVCTPSLPALQQMQLLADQSKDTSPRDGLALLAVGDPAFSRQAEKTVEFVLRGSKLAALPEAAREAQEIARLYSGQRSQALTGGGATESATRAASADAHILHLATHGVLNNASPMYSYLVLAPGDGHDGLLETHEVMNLQLSADLAVLSACETARGKLGRGEGVIGLTWSLFVAGCPSTVASLWKVEDAATRLLMVEFHKNLVEKKLDKAEALRQAQLSVFKRYDPQVKRLRGLTLADAKSDKGQPKFVFSEGDLKALAAARARLGGGGRELPPFFWAGFMLVGDWR